MIETTKDKMLLEILNEDDNYKAIYHIASNRTEALVLEKITYEMGKIDGEDRKINIILGAVGFITSLIGAFTKIEALSTVGLALLIVSAIRILESLRREVIIMGIVTKMSTALHNDRLYTLEKPEKDDEE